MYTDLYFNMTNVNTFLKKEKGRSKLYHIVDYVENDFAMTVVTKWKLGLTDSLT